MSAFPEDAELQLRLPRQRSAGRRRSGGCRAVRGGAQRAAERGAGRRRPLEFRATSCVITLGKEWGATLAQIKSLAFFPVRRGRHRVRRAADA